MDSQVNLHFSLYRDLIKRLFDFFFALTALIFLFPLFILVPIILSVHFGGSPFFFQKRQGFYSRYFRIIKFRTYREVNNPVTISRVGAILRKYSIDELPQLINVLLGQMSLIGPRPLLIEYKEFYTDEESSRFLVSPGITGLSQVQLRNSSDWNARLKIDIDYVEKQSFLLDLKILYLTLVHLFSKKKVEENEVKKLNEVRSKL